MQDILSNPVTWIIVAALSEIIALSPLKDNSIVQLLLHSANRLKPVKYDPVPRRKK